MTVQANELELSKPTRQPGGVAELLVIALPMVISQSCETLMMFTGRLFLARLGPEHMSAAMGGGLTAFMFMTFFMGLTGYSTALVAQYLGSGQQRRCATAAMQGVWISLVAWPVMILCIPIGLWMFRAGGIAPEQRALEQTFFTYLVCASGIGLLRNCMASFFSGIGRTRIVMASAAVAMVVNVGCDYVLIFGKLGLPSLGIRGAAIGSILGSLCALGVLLWRFLSPQVRSTFGVGEAFRFDRELMGKLVRFGSPSGAEFFLNILAFNMVVLSFHSYGLVEATAMTITLNWDLVSFIPLIGVGIGVTSLVGRYMGAGEPNIAQRATISGVKLAAIYTCFTFTAFCIFPRTMVAVFSPSHATPMFAQVSELAVFMVRLVVVYLFADAMAIVFSSALRGAGDTFWTMVISVSGHWLLASTAIVAVRWMGASPKAAWGIVVVLVIVLAASFYLRHRSGAWRRMKIIEPPAPLASEGALATEVGE